MSTIWRFGDDARRASAAAWVVRLEAGDLAEPEAVAFDAWLCASSDNAAAFDAALATSHVYAASAAPAARALAERRPAQRPVGRRAIVAVGAVAAAAAVAVIVAPQLAGPAATETYSTGNGQRRTVRLADGSTIDLNAGTRLSVTLGRDARRVTLDEGQAVFDVIHDERRPFVIAAGDRTVTDVGTRFDVRRRDGKLSVTVAHGAVEVRPAEGAAGPAYRLHPGQRLDHVEGGAGSQVAAVEAEDVLGWRFGRLVYRGQPLSEVVADLNQQFPSPIRIEDPALAAAPISGVLILDDQDAVIRRLALLVPISAVRSDAGVVLRRDGAPGGR
ncbi:FecR family protein [uncultured Phenylobacterium sp.]|uniref:FecR family protein n=1 Tax=uncultured Phenylobacterium sp. TaxID=349273 RepID=UPI0025CE541D|nr:FecR domain-containing protein [uncultured Phenylobacterium sp.]